MLVSAESVVFRLWLCTFTLAVSGGAVLLLPLSIIANEALLIFPNSYYLQWIKASLISGLQLAFRSHKLQFIVVWQYRC